MFKLRSDEPQYAYLWDKETKVDNRYGQRIETVPAGNKLRGQSLDINGDHGIGDNPNRYKQHGFHFTADNCIGCHACEAACSEKNDNPSHIAFRSVGFVESGSYPDYARINISMACNHCDDPVCLKGCPTRAYTKFAEYGAVLQDPDICFGCGYCTWVCPYNAPQLDPVKGEVSKCNMCVDRLEVGLKPACVTACLGNALDFGVIENLPEGRDQVNTQIPGFPTPEITRPNIRFQLSRTLQRIFTRPDSAVVKYVRTGESFTPTVDEAKRTQVRQWNLKALLSSHENAHIAFTLSTQAVTGAFLLLVLGTLLGPALGLNSIAAANETAFWPLMGTMIAVLSVGLARLNLHLGKPFRSYRGFYNMRHSPVSREIAGVSAFFAGLIGYGFFSLFEHGYATLLATAAAGVGVLGALAGLYYMYRLYRIPARPFWDHWQTGASFIGSCLTLGGLLIAAVSSLANGFEPSIALWRDMAGVVALGLAIEAAGLCAHARDLMRMNNEGGVAHIEQTTRYGKSYLARHLLLGLALGIALLLFWVPMNAVATLIAGGFLLVAVLAMAIIGRAIFYVLVIPTTMPGAFFWRNKGFEQHARKTGLADMPQMGVAPGGH